MKQIGSGDERDLTTLYDVGYVCFPYSVKVSEALARLASATQSKFALAGVRFLDDESQAYDVQLVTERDSQAWLDWSTVPDVIQWEVNAGTNYWPEPQPS